MSNTLCELCHNPSPYMCPQCEETLHDEMEIHQDEMDFLSTQGYIKQPAKLYIGSGEDFMMEML